MQNDTLIGFLSIITLGAVGYAVYANRKLDRVADRFDIATIDLSKDISDVHIEEDVINRAVHIAVDRQAKKAAEDAANDIRKTTNADIKVMVKKEIDDVKDSIHDKTISEIERQVGNIDISNIRKEVINRAKDKAAEKFEDDLDEILEKYNKDLENVSKIYNTIADSVTKKSDSGMTFRIS